MTPDQKRIIQSIVCVLETGRTPSASAYGSVAILVDGAGVSYGIHQATAASGALLRVMLEYISMGGDRAHELRLYLATLVDTIGMSERTPIPAWAATMMGILRDLGSDPTMQAAQDSVFDRYYWQPASGYAHELRLVHPLSVLAIYDTWIQSGGRRVGLLRATFWEVPPSRDGDEREWTDAFIRARRAWLAGFMSTDPRRQAVIRRTVYRCDAIMQLVAENRWSLEPPLVVRGVEVT